MLTGSVFPKLEVLALRNAQITDEIAIALSSAEAADASSITVPGNTFVLTGALNQMTRSEAKEKLETLGATVSSTVSKTTNYLIAGEKAGSKMEKAKALGVAVLSEADMMTLLGESTDDVSDATGSILDRIRVLDLSMGTLSDRGAEALFEQLQDQAAGSARRPSPLHVRRVGREAEVAADRRRHVRSAG